MSTPGVRFPDLRIPDGMPFARKVTDRANGGKRREISLAARNGRRPRHRARGCAVCAQGRGQAQNETAIAQNPFDHSQLISLFNDYRRGDSTCGAAYSRNGGSSWTDATLPTGFTRGSAFGNVAREYWQGGG